MRQDLGQGFKDALETWIMMMLIFPKCCNVSFSQTLFFRFTIKTLDKWRHQKRLWRHHFHLNNFWFGAKKLTLISIWVINTEYVTFQKQKLLNDVTNNDVIGFKVNLFVPALENQLLFTIWLFCNFWIGCWTVGYRLFDTRWQTLKAEKGGSPTSKVWGFFWWLGTWYWVIVPNFSLL